MEGTGLIRAWPRRQARKIAASSSVASQSPPVSHFWSCLMAGDTWWMIRTLDDSGTLFMQQEMPKIKQLNALDSDLLQIWVLAVCPWAQAITSLKIFHYSGWQDDSVRKWMQRAERSSWPLEMMLCATLFHPHSSPIRRDHHPILQARKRAQIRSYFHDHGLSKVPIFMNVPPGDELGRTRTESNDHNRNINNNANYNHHFQRALSASASVIGIINSCTI